MERFGKVEQIEYEKKYQKSWENMRKHVLWKWEGNEVLNWTWPLHDAWRTSNKLLHCRCSDLEQIQKWSTRKRSTETSRKWTLDRKNRKLTKMKTAPNTSFLVILCNFQIVTCDSVRRDNIHVHEPTLEFHRVQVRVRLGGWGPERLRSLSSRQL